jgi:aarF domain-containing kinase
MFLKRRISSIVLGALTVAVMTAATAPVAAFTTSDTTRTSSSSSSSSSVIGPLHVAANAVDTDVSPSPSSASGINKNDDKKKDEESNSVDFPPPISEFERLKRAATFWSAAVPIVGSYYYLMNTLRLQELLGKEARSEAEIESMWDALHEDGAAKMCDTITDLKGFYVKTAQIISSRQDLFPKQYTEALAGFTDFFEPMPAALARAVVEAELLNADETFEDVFAEFDPNPLGAASIAQVHRAILTEKYGGREVAIKIQRPSIESKLLGDVANLKAISKQFRNNPNLPLDYYTVFAELESQLADEFDFVAEAVSMDRIYQSLIRAPDGTARELPLVIPRPVPGLISKRVLVMDYLKGVPLTRAREEMIKKGIDPESPEAKLFSRNLLKALTTVFGRNILETGFFHADPHGGNIFVLDDGQIGLIDFGQVKQISGRNRETLCKIMISIAERKGDERPEDLKEIGRLALELGVELKEDAQDEAAAAVGMWLFDGSVTKLPGGYDIGELSPNSPAKELKTFPQDMVLVGRSAILIKGLSNRLDIPWSLAKEWAPIGRQVLESNVQQSSSAKVSQGGPRVRFREVTNTFKQWCKGRANAAARKLPSPVRTRLASFIVKRQERKSRLALMKRGPQ